ncbi:LytTR family transcriptional regulator [bacterium]|nr:LytTR family transcriptional regulator [bacterium]
MIKRIADQLRSQNRVAIKTGRSILFLSPGEIRWIEANKTKTLFHTTGGNYLVHEGISRLEEELDPEQFVRISRSIIVNIDQIRELQPWLRGDSRVVLHDGTILMWSRLYVSRLREILNQSFSSQQAIR